MEYRTCVTYVLYKKVLENKVEEEQNEEKAIFVSAVIGLNGMYHDSDECSSKRR